MLIGGVLLVLVGGLLLWGSVSAQKRELALRTVEPRTVAALEKLRTELGAEVGPGGLHDVCALEGTVECAHPLHAEVSGEACVYWAVRVDRE